LYDPATGTFAPTGSLTVAIGPHTATLLGNGKVLVVGSYFVENVGTQSFAELYDPVTGTFTPTGAPDKPRGGGHTATRLQNGNVLLVGGVGDGFIDPDATAELYDPATETFSYTGSVVRNNSIWFHAATLLPNGQVLVTGGLSSVGASTTSEAELYDPLTGTFTQTGFMGTSRNNHTATLLQNGKVLIAGKHYQASVPLTAELYDPSTGTFTPTGPMNTDGDGQTATLLQSGEVLIAGGASTFGEIANAELYDPITEAFTAIGPLRTARRSGHSATLLPNGKVLIAGGLGATGVVLSSAELYE
jgi:hypothetical protein